ncbi:MAG: hypothetical protein PHI12_14635 [Dehalococcoidales bacterium]|nr:hypothetical protein [Dehalococcoidales bacterium]
MNGDYRNDDATHVKGMELPTVQLSPSFMYCAVGVRDCDVSDCENNWLNKCICYSGISIRMVDNIPKCVNYIKRRVE